MHRKDMLLYRGPSLIVPDQTIIVVATGYETPSRNSKTGPMIQTWILVEDEYPGTAGENGRDRAICGDCSLRWYLDGDCYVVKGHGPRSIFARYLRGGYAMCAPGALAAYGDGCDERIGAYGDPGAAPYEVWEAYASRAAMRTGYSHQWRTCDQRLSRLCMASVSTPEEAAEAQSMGWRTFRDRPQGAPLLRGEFECPASEREGHRLQCVDCGACDGAERGARKASPSIERHGQRVERRARARQDGTPLVQRAPARARAPVAPVSPLLSDAIA